VAAPRAHGGRAKIPQNPSGGGEPLALRVVSAAARERLELRAALPTLVVPIESATVTASCRGEEATLDRSACLVAPGGAVVTLRSRAPSSRVALLGFGPDLVETTVRTYAKLGATRDRLARWLEAAHTLPRTVWVHEIVHRYVFERDALGERGNDATRFLEVEILKEIYFLLRDRAEGAERASIVRVHSPVVERALAFIEAHLFDAVDIPTVARHARASESTLLRTFRREVGCAASEYWRSRKLDEALALLRSGRVSVAEVSAEVGYTNATAFAHAFRQRFGGAPSSFRPTTRVRRAPGS
jgi:AraC-like DNA-binding protein